MSNLCDLLDIPFLEESFVWKKYKKDFDAKSLWHEQKRGQATSHWHGRALQSTKIGKPNIYETDDQGNPTFSEILNLEHRDQLKALYQENLIYYKMLLKEQSNFLF